VYYYASVLEDPRKVMK